MHYSVLFLLLLVSLVSALSAQQQVYVVYLGAHSGDKSYEEIEDIHHSYLHAWKEEDEGRASIIYSYKRVINGFSAMLTPQQAHTISEMEGVISVFRSQPSRLHTTRSWDFINLLEANWDASKANMNGEEVLKKAGYGKDVTVGVLDSGIWPESESFNDEGMEPIPASWNGICQSGDLFNSSHCNRKVVGARFYLRGYEAYLGQLDPTADFRSPRDMDGHGTHTASTVGGRRVPNAAAIGGLGNGTASGGAPLVRLSIYKVCWPVPRESLAEGDICLDDDMLAAIDDAIADGVGVISVSIGGNTSKPFTQDGIAIGALHAVQRNIVVACSAGNSGPDPFTVSNVAPWIITVGASSIDRVFSSPLQLGNGIAIEAQSVTPFQRATYPLVYAADAQVPGTTTNLTTGLCLHGTLSPSLVKEKAVFCRGGGSGEIPKVLEVQTAGGVAAVIGNILDGMGVAGRPYLIPTTVILSEGQAQIINYTTEFDTAATATLTPIKTLTATKPAPFMAAFTSRGPSYAEPNILKPDIIAPGLNILAAWSEASSPLKVPADTRVVKYQFESGTSMACPHVSAVAALVKAIHPDWSSAAIRSALITSTKVTNNQGKTITDASGINSATPFEFGAGHIQPSMAADPGLVYDATYQDYLLFICSSSGGNQLDPFFTCPKDVPSPSNLNYPSLAIAKLDGTLTVGRTVTNVGPAKSSYSVTINQPAGYSVDIAPTALNFSAVGEKQSFNITVKAESGAAKNVYAFGSFVWSDGTYQVTSPIAVSTA